MTGWDWQSHHFRQCDNEAIANIQCHHNSEMRFNQAGPSEIAVSNEEIHIFLE